MNLKEPPARGRPPWEWAQPLQAGPSPSGVREHSAGIVPAPSAPQPQPRTLPGPAHGKCHCARPIPAAQQGLEHVSSLVTGRSPGDRPNPPLLRVAYDLPGELVAPCTDSQHGEAAGHFPHTEACCLTALGAEVPMPRHRGARRGFPLLPRGATRPRPLAALHPLWSWTADAHSRLRVCTPSREDTSHMDLSHHDLVFTPSHLQRHHSQIRSHPPVPGGQEFGGGHHSTQHRCDQPVGSEGSAPEPWAGPRSPALWPPTK